MPLQTRSRGTVPPSPPGSRSRSASLQRTPRHHNARFDEGNIRITHTIDRDYGLMTITESKTPFPRKEDPVDAALLRGRLLERLAEANRRPSISSIDVDIDWSYISLGGTMLPRASQLDATFEARRRRYDTAEFTITRQRTLAGVLPSPIASIPTEQPRVSLFTTPSLPSTFINVQ